MGGPGSGHGIKRPDHPTGELLYGIRKNPNKNQRKHLKSIFSGLPDPSVHAHKLERDRAAGNMDYDMKADLRKQIGLEYKEMQDIARKHAEEMMRVLHEIANDPDQPSSARVTAANSWLDRAYGKSATMNFNVNTSMDAKPSELSDAELAKRIDSSLRTIEGQRGKTEEAESPQRPINLCKYN